MEFLQSRKGQEMVSYKGYLYRKDKSKLNTINWRCSKTGCKGRLVTNVLFREQNDPPILSGKHCHPPNPAEAKVRMLENSVKFAALATSDPPNKIVQCAISTATDEVAEALSSAANLRQTVRRKRKSEFEHSPAVSDVINLVIPPNLSKTSDQRTFLLYDSGPGDEHRIIIFSTDEFLQLIHDSPFWICDGSFEVSSELFYQVFTVHMLFRNNLLPCIFALLPNKEQVAYREMWTRIKKLKPGISPRAVLIDFDLASRNVFKEVFPEVKLYGCIFHFSQSLWRKILENDLQKYYNKYKNIRLFVKSLLALGFVPSDEVSDAFDELVADYPPQLGPIVKYFEVTYVGRRNRKGQRRQPLFPINLWNAKCIMFEERLASANYQLQNWHKTFQDSTNTSKPSIFGLVEALQREEAFHHTNFIQILPERNVTADAERIVACQLIKAVLQNRKDYANKRLLLKAIAEHLEINFA